MRNAITNHIFEHYRKKQRKIEKAKTLLRKNNHVVYEKKKQMIVTLDGELWREEELETNMYDDDFYYAAMDFITPRSCLTHTLNYK